MIIETSIYCEQGAMDPKAKACREATVRDCQPLESFTFLDGNTPEQARAVIRSMLHATAKVRRCPGCKGRLITSMHTTGL